MDLHTAALLPLYWKTQAICQALEITVTLPVLLGPSEAWDPDCGKPVLFRLLAGLNMSLAASTAPAAVLGQTLCDPWGRDWRASSADEATPLNRKEKQCMYLKEFICDVKSQVSEEVPPHERDHTQPQFARGSK